MRVLEKYILRNPYTMRLLKAGGLAEYEREIQVSAALKDIRLYERVLTNDTGKHISEKTNNL